MKRLTYELDEWESQWIFKPVRSKAEVINLLMRTIKLMLIKSPVEDLDEGNRLTLVVSKMSRLFFYSENKQFSICFPFKVRVEEDGRVEFQTHLNGAVDSRLTSVVISLVESEAALSGSDPWVFTELLVEAQDELPEFWDVFRELMIFEEGYIRYDHDPEHVDGHKHPLYHLDIFYTSRPTFKIGLRAQQENAFLIDALEPSSNCYYLAPFD